MGRKGNSYFQFKRFTVHQSQCAMKVCTDASVFGAFTARFAKVSNLAMENVLDIGAGTGLLSLMLAQESPAHITAIELDPAAAQQAEDNFKNSPWADRLHLMEGAVQTVEPGKAFDLIISNPPFYEQSLQGPSAGRNRAMHAVTLSYPDLIAGVLKNLSEGGVFALLLPFAEFQRFQELAAGQHLHVHELLHLRQTPKHEYFRTIGFFRRNVAEIIAVGDLVIKNSDDKYTPTFSSLMANFYLHL
ncbi:methyltransferase [Chitinophaga caeni]|uniref:tRNA1(Val) (adenine(37)-N6)-methyltransferase n=1 Tax=Chitinophaga caeni TaxID=2029983 RepID=A0A291QWL1_9BACT|nr:methyltransferase [Chitinophaga caeni]ATL48320.1 methyltransferase [Chitinophaga caeni]